MGLVSSEAIINDAYRNNYAIAAFAAHNLEILKAICDRAEKLGSPVLIQTTPGTLMYLGIDRTVSMVRATAENASIPIALHLDHGDSFETAMKCLRAGFTSIMIDGSHLPFEENIKLVRSVVQSARPMGVPVEAELGTIAGIEDDLEVDASLMTDPMSAKIFVEQTEIDFFAPAFGTAHGLYKKEPKLRFDLLEEIRNVVDIPIVMHGASGVPDESLKKALHYGVAKVNFSTELKEVFVNELKKYLFANPKENDPRKYFIPAMEAVSDIIEKKIEILCSNERVGQG